jgi:hypothetical protein
MIDALALLGARLGRTPAMSEAAKYGLPTESTYRARFGSWTTALRRAGLKPNPPHRYRRDIKRRRPGPKRKWTKPKIIAALQALARQLRRTPTQRDLLAHGPPYIQTVADKFGSLREAQVAAGLLPNKSRAELKWTDQEMLDQLRRLHKKLGRRPGRTDVNHYGPPSYSAICKRFGNYRGACLAAGFKWRRRQRT